MGTIGKHNKRLEQRDFKESNLLSLTRGLLQMILESMTETELYTTACVCALLNEISLRVFFSQRGIEVSKSKLNIVHLSLPNDQQFLSLLRISFFIDFIQHFECELLHASPKGVEFRRDSERVLELILSEKGTTTAPFDVKRVDLYMEHTYVRIDPEDTCDRLLSSSCTQIDLRYGIGEYAQYGRTVGKVPFQPIKLCIVDPEDLLDFPKILPVMQTLHTLSIKTDTMLWETRQLLSDTMPRQSLPYLTNLTTTAAYAVVLRSAHLPNLKSFELYVPDVARMFTYTSQGIFKSITQLILSLERPELRPIVTADFSDDDDSEGDVIKAMTRCMNEYHLNGLGSGTSLDNISVLKVIGLNNIVTRENAGSFHVVLTQWLKLFRGLCLVEFHDNADDLSEVELSVVYPLIYYIHQKCPNIVMLSIDDVEYDPKKIVHDYGAKGDQVVYKESTLGDVNEDIFFLIFDYLSTKEVYSLSALCRNLRDWALSAYLHRRGIEDPSESVHLELTKDFDEDVMTDMSALTLSSIRQITNLTLKVNLDLDRWKNPQLNVSQIWEYLNRFNRLVQKLSSIGMATLELGDKKPTIPRGFISGHSKVLWTQLILSIFNALGEKSNTLIVRGNGILGSLTFSIADGSPVPSQLIQLRLPSFPLEHRLSSLKLNERAVIMPLFNSWLIKAFTGSRHIRNIEFLDISDFGASHLTALGNTFPSIERLRIYSRAVLPSGIMTSFNQLLGMKEITLIGYGHLTQKGIHIPAAPNGPVSVLPLLERLTAIPQYISFMMGAANLKNLRYLTIVLPYDIDEYNTNSAKFSLSVMPSLAPYADVLKRLPNLVLNLHVCIGNLTQLEPSEISADGWEEIAQITRGVILQQLPLSRNLPSDIPPPPDAMQGIENLRRWLVLFPSLETLEFHDITDLSMMDRVLQQLNDVKACPGLKTLLVNGNQWSDVDETKDSLSTPELTT